MLTRPLRYAIDATNAIFSATSTARSCLGTAYFGFVAGVTRGSEFGRSSGPVPGVSRVTHTDLNLLLLKVADNDNSSSIRKEDLEGEGKGLPPHGGPVTNVSEQSRKGRALVYNSSPGRICGDSPTTDARQHVKQFSKQTPEILLQGFKGILEKTDRSSQL